MRDVSLVMSVPKGSKVGPPARVIRSGPDTGAGVFRGEYATNSAA